MDTKLTGKTRIESDLIGAREIPAEALYGVQTLRGIENFSISKFRLSEYPLFIKGPVPGGYDPRRSGYHYEYERE